MRFNYEYKNKYLWMSLCKGLGWDNVLALDVVIRPTVLSIHTILLGIQIYFELNLLGEIE